MVMRPQIQAVRIVPHAAVVHYIEHDKGTSRPGIPESSCVAHVDLPHAAVLVCAEIVRMTADICGDCVVHQGLPETVSVGLMNIQGIILVT